MIMIINVTKKD